MVGTTPTHPEGCLFCRRADVLFTSEEHIISSRFGNEEHVLDPGVVCDRCNHGRLARADRALTDFEPLTILRSERGLGTRSGQVALTRFKEAEVAFTAPGVLSVFASGASPVRKVGPSQFRMTTTGTSPLKAARAMLILRAMWKTAIECIYVDHGPEAAFHPILDPARREVIGDGDGHGWVVTPKKGNVHNDVSTTYQPRIIDGNVAIPMLLDIFGVRFYSDLVRRVLPREYIESTLPWPANVWVFPKTSARAATVDPAS